MNAPTPASVFADAAPAPEYRLIPLAQIALSDTPMQKLRRQRFDKTGLADLAASVKLHGVMQPILVRPRCKVRVHQDETTHRWYAETLNIAGNWNTQGSGHKEISAAEREAESFRALMELVAGERRVMASRTAGLTDIPAMVRELSDLQVVEMQVVENNQREGLHELIEAEGFEQLMKVHKLTAEQIAEKVGRSKRYVWNRLKLTELCPEARQAFYDTRISASVAYLIARIAHHDTQRQALKDLTHNREEQPTVLDAARLIQNNYMLMLRDAPFDVADAQLCPKAGTCAACPKRTGNQKELFGDIKNADVCTDPVCFAAKRDAHMAARRAEIEARGGTVITGKAARVILPNAWSVAGGHVKPDDTCWDDAKQRTYRQILGKSAPVIVVENPHKPELLEFVKSADIAPLLKEKGIKKSNSNGSSGISAKDKERIKAEQAKHKIETAVQASLLTAIRDKHPGKLTRPDLLTIAKAIAVDDGSFSDLLAALSGINDEEQGLTWKAAQKRVQDHIKALDTASEADLARFIFVWALHVQGTTPNITAAAKRLKIDPVKVRKQVIAKLEAPQKTSTEEVGTAPAAVKKPATKKKLTKK